MSNSSYSNKIKKQIDNSTKKKCCQKVIENISISEKNQMAYGIDIINDCCKKTFLRTIFLIHGSLSDPNVRYRIDLSFLYKCEAEYVAEFIRDNVGDKIGFRKRGERFIVYINDSTEVEDFLAYIGANNPVYDIVNARMSKEMKNYVQRKVNCELGNLSKSIVASDRMICVIQKLYDANIFFQLDDEEKQTAVLRLENPQASISQLALMHTPEISKSGVVHRFNKIVKFAPNNGIIY